MSRAVCAHPTGHPSRKTWRSSFPLGWSGPATEAIRHFPLIELPDNHTPASCGLASLCPSSAVSEQARVEVVELFAGRAEGRHPRLRALGPHDGDPARPFPDIDEASVRRPIDDDGGNR